MKKIFLLIFILTSMNIYAQNPQIKTANGTLQGVTEVSGIISYKGIPFAQPPVGELRWKEPQPPLNWTGIRKADHFGPQAMQRAIYGDMRFRSDGKSEDCLYLNIWTPAKTASQKLAVLVYFYGGGFNAGDGSEYRYDGEALAKKGIITVTVNYRLGIFGFLAHPELTAESAHHSSGNYGLLDQHAALVWVKKNIAAFGGDPDKITIGGESAGSMSVCGQVASPLSKGLFRAAIGESGSLLGNLSPTSLADAEEIGVKFAASIGAGSLADLRKISADSLLKISARGRFPIAVDGYFLTLSPQAIFNAGKQMDIPLLAGWNSAESGPGGVLGSLNPTLDNYKLSVQKLYNDRAQDILNVYAPATDADVAQAATDLASDRFIAYATWKFIDMQTKTGNKPVYRYFFTRKRPVMVGAPAGTADHSMGAAHASEIEFALGNLPTNKVYAWTPDDYKTSETMQNYFVNFVKTTNPNGTGLPVWERLKSGNPRIMIINEDSQSRPETNAKRYAVMDSFFNK
ncbi:carboxylesterase/lipase family protein [Mucilaginibacter sp. UR6-11]|uniref:carboxylesterase/lipase family protein n=1 Tax=Mucilaginibacter sp. UR6-11 TaxID=1435644 RepID=UPI001E29A9DE|nr:carboxylesterase family protein [Mucilaginibacter sp. UR6-11]MCC8424900.1 carboxylesterase family protein [Mucilaginibacter sp. UR6-11]